MYHVGRTSPLPEGQCKQQNTSKSSFGALGCILLLALPFGQWRSSTHIVHLYSTPFNGFQSFYPLNTTNIVCHIPFPSASFSAFSCIFPHLHLLPQLHSAHQLSTQPHTPLLYTTATQANVEVDYVKSSPWHWAHSCPLYMFLPSSFLPRTFWIIM